MNNIDFTIFTFYQFKKFKYIDKYKNKIKEFCYFHKIRGTILIAKEGINGTVAGLKDEIYLLELFLKELGFSNLESKKSFYKYMPFNYLKVRVKEEIVTFGNNILDVENNHGSHINPENWNELINSDDVLVIDVRNNFEHKIGTFKKAINPKTKKFSEFKKFVDNEISSKKNKKIALFCTGGIRCEKASAYMKSEGFKNVYQLKGGILKYLEVTKKNKSRWIGECFVFDNRVSVINKLNIGSYELCHSCRTPLSKKDRLSDKYKKGISCHECYKKLTPEKKKRLLERNKQIKISKRKGLYNPYIKKISSDFF